MIIKFISMMMSLVMTTTCTGFNYMFKRSVDCSALTQEYSNYQKELADALELDSAVSALVVHMAQVIEQVTDENQNDNNMSCSNNEQTTTTDSSMEDTCAEIEVETSVNNPDDTISADAETDVQQPDYNKEIEGGGTIDECESEDTSDTKDNDVIVIAPPVEDNAIETDEEKELPVTGMSPSDNVEITAGDNISNNNEDAEIIKKEDIFNNDSDSENAMVAPPSNRKPTPVCTVHTFKLVETKVVTSYELYDYISDLYKCEDCNYTKKDMYIAASNVSPSTIDQIEREIINRVNALRIEKGLSALWTSKEWDDWADIRSSELATKYSHTRPDGNSWLYANGRYYTIGENIAAGQSSGENFYNAFYNSSQHKDVVLADDAVGIAVGIYINRDGTTYCAMIIIGEY